MTAGSVAERDPAAVGEHERARCAGRRRRRSRRRRARSPRRALVVDDERRPRPDRRSGSSSSRACSRAASASSLRERVVEAGEALEVLVRERDREVVRDDGAAHAERASRVHLAHDAATDLDGLQAAAERLAEGAFDEPLEPALEPLESHRSRCYRRDLRKRRCRSLVRCPLTREWRNWQTRRIQVPVPARVWGFKSPLAHSEHRRPRITRSGRSKRPGRCTCRSRRGTAGHCSRRRCRGTAWGSGCPRCRRSLPSRG